MIGLTLASRCEKQDFTSGDALAEEDGDFTKKQNLQRRPRK